MKTSEILRQARELYEGAPSHAPVGMHPAFGTYCAITAISNADDMGDECHYTSAKEALRRAAGLSRALSIPGWNATHTTAEVLAVFDRAIANEEAREQEYIVTPVSTIPDAIPA